MTHSIAILRFINMLTLEYQIIDGSITNIRIILNLHYFPEDTDKFQSCLYYRSSNLNGRKVSSILKFNCNSFNLNLIIENQLYKATYEFQFQFQFQSNSGFRNLCTESYA